MVLHIFFAQKKHTTTAVSDVNILLIRCQGINKVDKIILSDIDVVKIITDLPAKWDRRLIM